MNAALLDFTILGASWTLQVEFLAIPFILACFWGNRRFGWLAIVGCYVAFFLVLSAQPTRSIHWSYQQFLSCFAIGALVPTSFGLRVSRWTPSSALPWSLLAMLTIRHCLGLHWWSMDIMQLAAGLLINRLYHGATGIFAESLTHPVSQWPGRVSDSSYLFSVVFLILADHWTHHLEIWRAHPLEFGLVLGALIVLATVVTAHYIEGHVEQPGVTLGRAWTRFWLSPASSEIHESVSIS